MHLIGLGYAAEDIILVGDSAGGNLALSLCRYLIRYADEKFPSELSLPRILKSLVSSFSLLLGETLEARTTAPEAGLKTKYTITYSSLRSARSIPMGGNIDNTSPWISPISRHVDCVSFEGFPKTFIAAGGLEELKDQVVVSKETLERDIGEGNVEYYLAPLALHDFIMLSWHESERTNGFKKVSWMATL